MRIVVYLNCVAEMTFLSGGSYDNPYQDVDMDVVFRAPGGTEMRVPAYWAGDNVWKVRFAPAELGEYRFETQCTNTADSGLHGRSGVVEAVKYAGENPLFVHGRLRVAGDKRHFEHSDGTPFFWSGDTWWMGLSSRLDWPQGFATLAADRVAKGFNVIQGMAGRRAEEDVDDPRGRNEAGLPFAEKFTKVNTAYFDHADLKIGHLVQSGLTPCIVGMWGYYLPQLGVDNAKRYWRYLVARYGAYPVVWCICGEGAMAYYLSKTPKEDVAMQRAGWTQVMAHVRATDPYHNLITIHPTQYGREQVEDPTQMDFEMLQTGHGDFDSVCPTANTVMTAVGREPRMPVVNGEVNYEGILGRCWQNVQRLCFYGTVLNGAAGFTYGANGIWQMSTVEHPYGPSPHGRCWGNTPWNEAYRLPGSRQVGLGGAFMRRFPWWELERHPEWVEPSWDAKNPYSCTATGIPGRLRIIYIPMLWDPPLVKEIEKGVTYRAYYFDPCTGTEIDAGKVARDEHGCWRPPLSPEVHDWLLVMQAE